MTRTTRAFIAASLSVLATLWLRADGTQLTAAADVQRQLGDLLFADGRYNEALDAYTLATRTDEPKLRRQAQLGVVKTALRTAEFKTAYREAQALTKFAPRDAEALSYYSDALWAEGLFEESENAARDALSINAESARAHHGLARALAARSRLEDAEKEALAAVQLGPREGEFHHTLGAVYERQHRYDEAASALNNFLNLLPNKDRSVKAAWTRAEIRFLKAFEGKTPLLADASSISLHTVPFRLERNKVLVRGKVNGSTESEFVLDTGSEMTVISRRTAQRAGVVAITETVSAGVGEVGLRGLQVGRLDKFEIAGIHFQNVPVLVKNPALGGLPTREGESFSPLALGLSMSIDYQRRQLTIGKNLPETQADIEMPMWVHRLALVRGLVSKELPASFVVDTGGEVLSISSAVATALPRRPTVRHIPLKVYGTSGWDRDAFLLPHVDLSFNEIQLPNFSAVVLNLRAPSVLLGFEVGGIIGHKFLSQYRVGIDVERSKLLLTKNRG